MDITGLRYESGFNHCDVFGQQTAKKPKSAKKRRLRAITPFKVIEVDINQKHACDFLSVINSN